MPSKIAMIVIAKTTSINVNADAWVLLLLFTLLCVVALSRCRVVNLTYKNYCDSVISVKRKRKNISVFSKFSPKKCFRRKYSFPQKIFPSKISLTSLQYLQQYPCFLQMVLEWIKTIVILPFNVLVVVPAFVLYFMDYTWVPNDLPLMVLGGVFLAVGLSLAIWTMWLFAHKGKGTAAPWNPPKHLVVEGPYAYVRNPMITSVFIMQIAEALLLNSWHIFGLFGLFLVGNMIYFPLFEENDLKKRFGKEYTAYKRNVPRWVPRLTPWKINKNNPTR
jgi:protein-S-isoprenylcysteine O-methyltransferase Ste14